MQSANACPDERPESISRLALKTSLALTALSLLFCPAAKAEIKRVCKPPVCGQVCVEELGTRECHEDCTQECEDVVVDEPTPTVDGGDTGGHHGGPTPGDDNSTAACKRDATTHQTQCENSAKSSEQDCERQRKGTGISWCNATVDPILPKDITNGDFVLFSRTLCVSPPTPRAHETADAFERRYNLWEAQCIRDIAAARTATERGACLDQLVNGGGAYFDKFKLSVSAGSGPGISLSGSIEQGILRECFREQDASLAACRQQKQCDDAKCDGRHIPNCQ